MSKTDILKVTQIANGQIDQYITVNEAISDLERAGNDFLLIDLSSGDASITNTAPDYEMLRHQVFRSSGNAVARTLTFSENKRAFKVDNTGSAALSVAIGATTVSVPAGDMYSFYADGTADGLKRAL